MAEYFAAGGENGLIRVFDTVRLSDPVTLQSAGAKVEAMTFSGAVTTWPRSMSMAASLFYPFSVTALLGKAATITKDRRPEMTNAHFSAGLAGLIQRSSERCCVAFFLLARRGELMKWRVLALFGILFITAFKPRRAPCSSRRRD